MSVSRRSALFAGAAAGAGVVGATVAHAAPEDGLHDLDRPLVDAWRRWHVADRAVRAADEDRQRVMDALGGASVAAHLNGARPDPAFAEAEARCAAARHSRDQEARRIAALPAEGATGALIKVTVAAGGPDARTPADVARVLVDLTA